MAFSRLLSISLVAAALVACAVGCSRESTRAAARARHFRPIPGLSSLPARSVDRLDVGQGSAKVDLGPDWFPMAQRGAAPFVCLGRSAGDLVFFSQGEARELRLRWAQRESLVEDQVVSLELNGRPLGELEVPDGTHESVVALPAGALLPGLNRLTFRSRLDVLGGLGIGLEGLSLVGPGEPGAKARANLDGDVGVVLRRGLATWAPLRLSAEARLHFGGTSSGGPVTLRLAFTDEPGTRARWETEFEVATVDWDFAIEPRLAGAPLGVLSLSVVKGTGEVHLSRAEVEAQRELPNVLLISVDTLRADHVHDALGSELPTLTAFAEEGVVFERAFAHSSATLPSHATLFSSQLPPATGVRENGQRVPRGVPLLAEWLADFGYETRSATSIGTLWSPLPDQGLDRGFRVYEDDVREILPGDEARDRVLGILEGLQSRAPYFLFAHFSDPHAPYNAHGEDSTTLHLALDGEPLPDLEIADMKSWSVEPELAPGWHVLQLECASRFVARTLGATFDEAPLDVIFEDGGLLEVGTQLRARFFVPGDEPVPVRLTSWLADTPSPEEAQRRYVTEVAYADRMLGELLRAMRDRGLLENTWIVFLSDHGESFGEHGHFGHVDQVFAESLHVPLLLVPPAGSEVAPLLASHARDLVRLVDVAPTILDALGLPPMPTQVGRSLLGPSDGVLYSEAIPAPGVDPLFAFRDDEYLMIHNAATGATQLFDLLEDPGETRDVFAERGALRQKWLAQLMAIAADYLGRETDGPNSADMEARLEALGY